MLLKYNIDKDEDYYMKTILCFGDSITRGAVPVTNSRYPRDIRYPGRLQKLLGEDYYVVEEGLNGRTTMLERKIDTYRNGLYYIMPCLGAHQPIDYIIVMLGTNDSLLQFNLPAEEIAKGMDKLIQTIKDYTTAHQGYIPVIILCPPPYIGENWQNSPQAFDLVGAREKTIALEDLYRDIAREKEVIFFNTNDYCKTSFEDSVHFDEEGHRIFADRIAEIILNN